MAFDRLEEADFGAKAVLSAKSVGTPVLINEDKKKELDQAFIFLIFFTIFGSFGV